MTSIPLNTRDPAGRPAPVHGVVGPVRRRGTVGYAEEVGGFNLAISQAPDLAVGASCTADVVASLRHAAEHGLRVAVQATGHGAGRPCADGLLVNTSRMDEVSIDVESRTALVAAGARWEKVVAAAAPHGLAPLCGSSLDVGVMGYTLGGGLGPMARTFGFAADHVLSLELVTPDGLVRDVDPETEPELFWGLRGGKCELGIVTAAELALMPVRYVYGGGLFFPGVDAARVLRAWRDWSIWLPDGVNTSIALLRLPDLPEVPEPLRGRLTVHLRYVYVGRAKDGEMLLEPMRTVARPLLDNTGWLPYDAIGLVHNDPKGPLPVWDRSALLTELPDAAIDALLATAGPDVDVPLILAELRLLGGAVATQPRHPNAVGGRRAAYNCYVVGPVPPPLAEATPAAGNAVLDSLAPWCTGSTLVNFQGTRTAAEDVRLAWDEADRVRLDELHASYDPEGICRFALPTRLPG